MRPGRRADAPEADDRSLQDLAADHTKHLKRARKHATAGSATADAASANSAAALLVTPRHDATALAPHTLTASRLLLAMARAFWPLL